MFYRCRLKDNTYIVVEADNNREALTKALADEGFARAYVSSYDAYVDEESLKYGSPTEMYLNPEDFAFLKKLLDDDVQPR